MNADHILIHLDKAKRTGAGKWMACCPAHADKSPSLSIKDWGDKLTLHCFAGCDTVSIINALGLTWGDLFLESLDPAKKAYYESKKQQEEIQHHELIIMLAKSDMERGKTPSDADKLTVKKSVEFLRRVGNG